VAVALLAACGRAPAPDPGAAARPPERVIAVAPSVVEILYALEVGDRVVGVGDYAHWPPEVESKPRIGGLFDARLEEIAALRPELAILLPSEAGLGEKLAALGVEILTVRSESLADVEEAVTAIAERMGRSEPADRFVAEFRTALEPHPLGDTAPRVLLAPTREVGRVSGILVAGPDTFYQELLDRMGATNVFADAPVRYPQVGAEEIVARQPGVVVELQPRELAAERVAELVADWESFGAAFAPCVRVVTGDWALLPGPRLPLLYAALREAVASCG